MCTCSVEGQLQLCPGREEQRGGRGQSGWAQQDTGGTLETLLRTGQTGETTNINITIESQCIQFERVLS